ncbi:MAG TPA: transposase [Pirellulaceae bacterium]|jgi:putative transposase|nr:transposase [Pirellulaceae bacterium]
MSRYRRSHEGRTFFFTVVTHERCPILCTDLARAALRDAIRETRKSRPFDVVAFVLLPDYLHTVWELPEGDLDYATRWREVKTRFTRTWTAFESEAGDLSLSRTKRGERGVWQRRFFEHTIRDERDLRRGVDYVHVNPMKHGLVDRVRDWEWSTFHRYVRLGEYSPDWGSSADWYGDEFCDYE